MSRAFIVRYRVQITAATRSKWMWIRPEFSQNLSAFATRFSSEDSARSYVQSLRLPNLLDVQVAIVNSEPERS